MLIWKIAMCGGEILTLRKIGQKFLEGFEVWSSRRMEKIKWTEYVRNEVLQKVKEERNILHMIKRRKDNCIVHILRGNYWPVIDGPRDE
jgi:hypothetical protein